ncbi:MAG: metallophosphoesterase family protein [Thermoleophilia bacterium]
MELAFFSDIHGNVAALRAVLADLASRGISDSYCLGDMVGYGPDPNGVIDAIRAAAIPTILGNYDDGIAFDRGECGCFYPDDEARRIGDASYTFTAATVTPEHKAWLRGCPRELRIDAGGLRLRLVHGSTRRINEYLLADRDERTYHRLAAQVDADVLLFGHTHVPWHRVYEDVLFVNVGSAGRPKDGDVRVAYTVLRLEEGRPPAVEVHRVAYDVEETARGVLAAGLPHALADAFRRGA